VGVRHPRRKRAREGVAEFFIIYYINVDINTYMLRRAAIPCKAEVSSWWREWLAHPDKWYGGNVKDRLRFML
jgi:hypothetical protein